MGYEEKIETIFDNAFNENLDKTKSFYYGLKDNLTSYSSINPKIEEDSKKTSLEYYDNKLIYKKNNFCTILEEAFYNCSSLKNLPDITRWNNYIISLRKVFHNCGSLESLPDLSQLNISKVDDINKMFFGFSKLKSISYISNWNTENIRDMSYLFGKCESLTKLDVCFVVVVQYLFCLIYQNGM